MTVVQSRLDLDKPPIGDDESARHVGTFDPQRPQRKPIGSLTSLVGLTDRHGVAVGFTDADRPGDLAIADAPRLAGGREVCPVEYCTRERYLRQEGHEFDGAILA